MEGFTFVSALDLKMGYYHIKLDSDAQNLYTIVFTWHMGIYKYKRLLMGMKIALFLLLFKMSCIKHVQDMEYVKTYLDRLLILTICLLQRTST
jgi:hypothetical protein